MKENSISTLLDPSSGSRRPNLPGNNEIVIKAALKAKAESKSRVEAEDKAKHLPESEDYSDLLTNEEAASYLGITPNSLEVWRCTKRYTIPYIRLGRLIRYRKYDLNAFLKSRTVVA